MSIVIDIILCAILIGGIVLGIKRGFVLTLAKPVKIFAALYLSAVLCVSVGASLIFPLIHGPITTKISSFLFTKCSEITAATATEKLPSLLKLAAGMSGIDVTALEARTSEEYIQQLVDNLATPAINLISSIIAFFILNIVLRIVLSLLLNLFGTLCNMGVIGVINKTIGCVFGFLFAFVIAWAFTFAFDYVIHIPKIASSDWAANFSGGFIYKFFRSTTPIDFLLSF